MKLAVKFYANIANPAGLPPTWPAETREVDDDATLPAGFTQLMTPAEFTTYKAAHQSAYDTWATAADAATATARATEETERAQAKAVVQDLKNGTGTTLERLVRCERALARVIVDTYR